MIDITRVLLGSIKTYSEIWELGKSAVEKFGEDPIKFKKILSRYKSDNFKKRIKSQIKLLSANEFRFNSLYICEYIECLIAILQVDLERPGFIKNFPDHAENIRSLSRGYKATVTSKFEKIYDEIIEEYNRYSGKNDFEYVKSLFEIEDLSVRVDDYISQEFQRLWKLKDPEIHFYLSQNYIYQETLLPKDYKEIVTYFDNEYKMRDNDLRWIDLYFENLEKILKEVHEDIENITPVIMKKINLTLT